MKTEERAKLQKYNNYFLFSHADFGTISICYYPDLLAHTGIVELAYEVPDLLSTFVSYWHDIDCCGQHAVFKLRNRCLRYNR